MTTAELALAILALLMTPGPTNTLLFLAGAEGGAARALRLIPAELAGYLAAVVPLALAGAPLLAALPGARDAVAVGAGLWVAWLAFRLWSPPGATATGAQVTAKAVLTTTLMNPKGLIFGLVLLPAAPALPAGLALFATLVVAVAAVWGMGGGLLRAHALRGGGGLAVLRRAAALWLAALAVGLVLRGTGLA